MRTTLREEISHRDAECSGEINDNAKGRIPFATLYSADIGPVPSAFGGELFLGPTSLFAKLANASAECDRGRRHNRIRAGMMTMFLETISIVHHAVRIAIFLSIGATIWPR